MDFPDLRTPVPPILTTFHPDCIGTIGTLRLSATVSAAWATANAAFYYPFRLTDWATAYQLLFWVGATSSGNIDMGIFDSQKNAMVRMGSTAMSATVNTVQELNITDTVMPPGDYLLGAACDNTTGTCFSQTALADELMLPMMSVYEQTGLTAAALTDPAVPVITTAATIPLYVIGIQFRTVF